MRRFAFAIVAVLCTGSIAAQPARAEPPAALAACANPALPHAILDGAFEGAETPLPIERADGAGVTLTLAVASDDPTRDLGLMCVTRLRPRAGMLFVFGDDTRQEFWMKNTLVPLDMVWVNANGLVTSVSANVPASTRETPDDRIARRSGYGKYVIELAGGEASRDGVVTGITLKFRS